MKKILVVFGGPSTEHDVSCQSAASLISALNKLNYICYNIGIDKNGTWWNVTANIEKIKNGDWINEEKQEVILSNNPNKKGFYILGEKNTFEFCDIDIIFPMIHGTIGEDGVIQGFAELMDIPIVSTDLFSSICSYDKVHMINIVQGMGIKVPKNLIIKKNDYNKDLILNLIKKSNINFPIIVKPSKGGSSIGISLVTNEKELKKAVEKSFCYDNIVMIEEQIKGSEIKLGILGNNVLKYSELSQVFVHGNGFEDYECKYKTHNTTRYLPAKIDVKIKKDIIETGVQIYKKLNFKVYARIDFFLTQDDEIYFNEINTIPGFTEYCSYPQMFKETGIDYIDLIKEMILLAENK